MKKLKYLFVAACLVPCIFSCKPEEMPGGEQDEPKTVELSLADEQATASTKALYSNLWAIRKKGWLFGHHDDLMYGRYWYNKEGRSDTKEVCGDYPAVYSLDFASFMDERATRETDANAIRMRCMKEAYDRGMVITACMHLNNPLTGGDSWDNSSKAVAREILTEGSDTRATFCSWLDRLVALSSSLKGSDGKQIPVIFRPFHEHTQTWSWWGKSCTTEEEFIGLWRFTIDYLKAHGVHNFIYAISPQMDNAKVVDDFYFRWPGNNYVDFIGMDCYQGINNGVFVNNLKVLSKVSNDLLKPCGVTETGVEGFKATDYWSVNIAAPMAGRKVSLLVTWRNKYVADESDKHFFSVFPGHPSEKDFVKMYNRSDTFFCSDLPDMYSPAENIVVK